jgi:hypothetical protein
MLATLSASGQELLDKFLSSPAPAQSLQWIGRNGDDLNRLSVVQPDKLYPLHDPMSLSNLCRDDRLPSLRNCSFHSCSNLFE